MSTLVEQVVAALTAARDLILAGHTRCNARVYWFDIASGDDGVNYCAVGALAASSPTTRVFDAGIAALRAVLPPRYRRSNVWPCAEVSEYNDAHTTAEVSRLYQNAIAAVHLAMRSVA
jgi:hypothetical protein